MKLLSSYLNYLPPVLWSPDSDPAQFLGRWLRLFEKLLSGMDISAQVIRAEASFTTALGNLIQLQHLDDAPRFWPGDFVTITGTAERAAVTAVLGLDIMLATPLAGVYGAGGTVRLADLLPGQTSFRVDHDHGITPGSIIALSQGSASETVVVVDSRQGQVSLDLGLTGSYSLAPLDAPVFVTDGLPLRHGDHDHEPLELTLDRLHRLFNPWQSRADFLPWLASWVALSLRPEWSDYQRRQLISQMVGIYQQRGLKTGLHTYLDIYALTKARPRIALDDGEAVWRLSFQANGQAALHAVVQSHTVSRTGGLDSVLLHPMGLAADSFNTYFVADQGDMSLVVPRPPALWRLSSSGDIPYQAGPPLPRPQPVYQGNPLRNPTAVAVDAANRVSLLDIGNITSGSSLRSAIFRFAPPGYALTTVIDQATVPNLPAVHPVDMLVNKAQQFLILDRGAHPLGDPPAGLAIPQIVVVSEGPLAVATHPLATVVEPTALVQDDLGALIVADAQDQSGTTPADLIRVDLAAGWTETSLLGAVPPGSNPLIFPVGLVFESPQSLLVCDSGVRWGWTGDASNRTLAETAAVYRVDLTQAPPAITPVTFERKLVRPTKMARDANGLVILSDRGETLSSLPQRNWRAGANEFGVTVLFSQNRPTTLEERNLIRRGIVQVVEVEKPGHTSCWLDA